MTVGPAPRTDVVTTGSGVHLERLVTGSGEPVTLFAHGAAGDIDSTRPLGSGVPGRRVFVHLRGHGGSDAPPGPWTIGDIADDLLAAADASGATRAVGVSLGAAALCRLAAARPDRFDRLVLFLPAHLEGPRPRAATTVVERLLALLAAGDAEGLAAALGRAVPAELRHTPAAEAYVRRRARTLRLAPQLATMPAEPAVQPAALAAVTAPVLVLGCHGDPIHPAAVAERLAAVLPNAELHLYPTPYPLWHDRADLRARISTFLAA
ncbi:alpha/beta fold hydrolase [Spirilliplanes yamanashiensis]|uniref:AB hydrolase-1 domain-containing protein n=1 Tax=Spirilliplanes yamanashiensis TaxID=42233 RepID=A0A8J3Y665_9ACTN|nr:alpha/beta hydrolase [Spirilliplanes yamanashiensis]MDP9814435.1 pimeloyl-ACP methyl ester carboxylesterase [Spirilliplanes yamanashiensis]GIJ02087.1 hypothetical protein Sya03_14390 [Spirilliplanes yamanashiensis]